MDNHEARNELPKHMPVEMAVAPDRKPYEHTHTIHTSSSGQNDHNKLAQHSLSPEKLGVVGYVKDVAGFVKDVVDDRREKKALVASRRRNSSSASSSESNARTTSSNQTIDVPVADIPDEKQRRRSSAEHHHHNTAFADAVTSLFPGVSSIGDVNEHGGCTHADELRSQMMHVNDQQETSMMNGGGRKLL